jgi:hypothetical protein
MSVESIKKFLEILNLERLEQFDEDLKDSWIVFSNTLKGETTIETPIHIEENAKYKTIIKFDGDIINDFPSSITHMNDELWKKHNAKVDDVMQKRKTKVLNSIEAWVLFSNKYLKYKPSVSLNIWTSYNRYWRYRGKRWILLNYLTILKQKLYTIFQHTEKIQFVI